MTTPIASRLRQAKTFLMLWGSGWKRRKLPSATSCRIEWQDLSLRAPGTASGPPCAC